jgi:hypothetical protein
MNRTAFPISHITIAAAHHKPTNKIVLSFTVFALARISPPNPNGIAAMSSDAQCTTSPKRPALEPARTPAFFIRALTAKTMMIAPIEI